MTNEDGEEPIDFSRIVELVGKYSKPLGELTEQFGRTANEYFRERERHQREFARLRNRYSLILIGIGMGAIVAIVGAATWLGLAGRIGAEALIFFLGTLVGYFLTFLGRYPPAPSP